MNEIDKVVITTQESAIRIIDKSGPLHNPADRDHCIQYMTAIGLIFGELTADHYEDKVAKDPRIDALRNKMTCVEDPRYTQEYLDADKRSIANAVQVFFKDGSEHRQSRRRISHRPPTPPCRRHAAAGAEVRGQSGVSLQRPRSAPRS